MGTNHLQETTRGPWPALFVGVTVALMIGAYAYFIHETERIRVEKHGELAVIGRLKSDRIAQWRRERLNEASIFANGPLIGKAIMQWLADPDNAELKAELQDTCRLVLETKGYADVVLVDTRGHILLSAKPQPEPLQPVELETIEEVLKKGTPVLGDLYHSSKGIITLDAVAPIADRAGQPAAAVIMREHAESLLYPLIQSWPTPSKTAETLLVRREGQGVLFLNRLRHRANTALNLREPLSRADLPAVQAALGIQGSFQGKDYRGVEALADLRAVPDSPWFMVAKVDAAEILAEAGYRGGVILLFVALSIVLAVSVTAYKRRLIQARLYEDLYRVEREQREAHERFKIILYSIGDAVIVTDGEGLVRQMNPEAERLTGYSESESDGKPLDMIFQIIDERSLDQVENPVTRVLREGCVVGLGNHTLLISQDGTEHPIADSGAPVRDESGRTIGVVLVFRDQSEERAAQTALMQREERYRIVADYTYDWEYWITPDERLAYCAPSCKRLSGYSAEEYIADPKLLDRIVHPDDAAIWRGHRTATERSHETHELDYRILDRNGEEIWIAHSCTPVYDSNDNFMGRRVANRDITWRKKAEGALLASERMLKRILAALPVGVGLARGRKMTWVNDSWARLFGFEDPVECAGFDVQDLYESEDAFLSAGEMLYKDLVAGAVNEIDTQMRRKDGSLFDACIRMTALDPEDLDTGRLAVIMDISERKAAETALEKSESMLNGILQAASIGIGTVNERTLGWTNRMIRQMTGFSEAELHGKSARILYPNEEEFLRVGGLNYGDIMKTGIGRLQTNWKRKDGEIIDVLLSSAPLSTEDSSKGLVFTALDITERIRAEEDRHRLVTAIEQAAEAVVMTNPNGTIAYVNPAFESITGYSFGEAVGKNPRILKSGQHDEKFYRSLWETITNGKVWRGRLTNKKKDGALFEVEATISPVRDRSGQIVNYVAVKRDVTKEVSLQEQLIRAQKMEAVGTLAGGIAHDFNNLLQVTMGYADLLLSDKPKNHPDHYDLQNIRSAARSGAELVRNLLTFSRKLEPKPVPMSLNKQITQIERLLRRTIPKMIAIRLELAEDLKLTNADPAQIEQIIVNLTVNAKDAMGEAGRLTIRTENVSLDEESCKQDAEAAPGDWVALTVTDTGHGMDRDTMRHIFEPFYTTKELGRGTGLGLAMVYGIVTQHGGYVACRSQPGEGTRFSVYLPAISAESTASAEESSKSLELAGKETVLLVDDEEMIRGLGKRILEKNHYTVLTAVDGKQALEVFLRERERIGLVVMDLIMPVMGGKDCLKQLLELDPDVRVLIASGQAVDASTEECLSLGAKAVLRKPFRAKQLLAEVRKALHEPPKSESV